MTIRRTLAAALAASAIAAPAASAVPADMHASVAQAAQSQQRQDLRGEHAQDAALHPRMAQAVNAPGATVVELAVEVHAGRPRAAHLGRQPEAAPAGARAGERPERRRRRLDDHRARHRHLAARDRWHRRPDEPQQGPAAHARQHLSARTQRTQRAPASSGRRPARRSPPLPPPGAHTMNIRRTLAAALAATAIAAPAAAAAQPADMHASTAIAAAKAQQRQDLRGEHAKDAAQHPRKTQASLLLASPGHPSESGNTTPLPPVTAQATRSERRRRLDDDRARRRRHAARPRRHRRRDEPQPAPAAHPRQRLTRAPHLDERRPPSVAASVLRRATHCSPRIHSATLTASNACVTSRARGLPGFQAASATLTRANQGGWEETPG